jgi:hypothetical protein
MSATTFESLFLIKHCAKHPSDEGNRNEVRSSVLKRLQKGQHPHVQSIRGVTTLTGTRTLIRGNESTKLESQDHVVYTLYISSSDRAQSLEASKRSARKKCRRQLQQFCQVIVSKFRKFYYLNRRTTRIETSTK